MCAIIAISDIVSEHGWASAYRTEEVANHRMQVFEVALHTLRGDVS